MNYRTLGKTGLRVSEIGLGGEWLERHGLEECRAVIDRCAERGINILDCWMSNPTVRSNIGAAIAGNREKWLIQGHIGSTWQDGQYVRSRKLPEARTAFEDLLSRFGTDYIDLGMIHYVDEPADWENILSGGFMDYVRELRAEGKIRHIGLSTHNPRIGRLAAESGEVELIMFSVNPAFDMLPATEDIEEYFKDEFDASLGGIDPERAELYRVCEKNGVGITVMKGFAGGRLFDAARSPFGVALSPAQCLHYCLTRPAVASVMVGFDTPEQVDSACAYCDAPEAERDYASVLSSAPLHAYKGQCTYCGHCRPCPVGIDVAMVNKLYDLASMQSSLPPSLLGHYRALEAPASACVQCGGCEERCPFGVPVISRMASAAAKFEGNL